MRIKKYLEFITEDFISKDTKVNWGEAESLSSAIEIGGTPQENIQRIREMMGLLIEDNQYYDEILDLYSEVGMEGLSKDEKEYLKSGGQTELPKRFKSEISQQKYDNFVKGEQTTELKSSDWEDIFDLQKIIDDSPNQVLVEYNFDGSGFYLDVLCSLVFPKNKEIIERLKNLNNYSSELSEIKNNKYYYVIPKHYLEHLNGIEYKNEPPESDSRGLS